MRNIFKNSFFYTLGDFLKNTAVFLLLPIYTRFLTPGDYGIVAMISSVAAFLSTFLMMGQSDAVMRFYFDSRNKEEKKTYISTILFFCIGVFLAFALLMTFFFERLFNLLFPGMPFKPYGLILCWTVFFSVFEMISFTLLKTEEKAIKFSVYNLLGFIVNTCIVLLFVVRFRMGAFGKVSADLLYAVIASVFFLSLIKGYLALRFSFRAIKETLKFGVPLILHQLSLWIINLSDRYCLQLFGSLGMVGIYSIGYNIAFPINFLSSSIGMAWTPFFFKTAGKEAAKAHFSRMTTYYTVITMFVTLVIAVFAKEAICIFTTKGYYEASRVIPVVALSYFFHALYKISTRILVYVKQTAKLSLCTMISAIINIVLNILWIPRYGIMGAAWATLFSFAFLFLVSYLFARKYYQVPFEYAKMAFVFALSTLAYFSSGLMKIDIFGLSIAYKIALLLVYAIVIYRSFFLSTEERKKLKLILYEKSGLHRLNLWKD